jgi:hypothetical protein
MRPRGPRDHRGGRRSEFSAVFEGPIRGVRQTMPKLRMGLDVLACLGRFNGPGGKLIVDLSVGEAIERPPRVGWGRAGAWDALAIP